MNGERKRGDHSFKHIIGKIDERKLHKNALWLDNQLIVRMPNSETDLIITRNEAQESYSIKMLHPESSTAEAVNRYIEKLSPDNSLQDWEVAQVLRYVRGLFVNAHCATDPCLPGFEERAASNQRA